MLTGEYCYKTYITVKWHFNSVYDFQKYHGCAKSITSKTYSSRTDKNVFIQLAKKFRNKEEYIQFLVANFLESSTVYIRFLNTEAARSIFNKWLKIHKATIYYFKKECKLLIQETYDSGLKFNDIFCYKNGYPIIIKSVIGGKLSFEIFMILDAIFNFSEDYKKHLKNDIIWCELKRKIHCYKPFMKKLNIDKYKKILLLEIENGGI